MPILAFPTGRAVFGPVVVPFPTGDDALALWDLTVAYGRFPGLYELKTPKTDEDMRLIGRDLHALPRQPRVGDDPEPGPLTRCAEHP